MLTNEETAALAAALSSKQVSAAKKAMEDETTTNVDLTVRLVGTSAKGKQPAPRQATHRTPWEMAIARSMDEALEGTDRGGDGKFKSNAAERNVLEGFRDLLIGTVAQWAREDIACGNDTQAQRKLKKAREQEVEKGSTLKMMAEMKAEIRKKMPTAQSQAAVSVAVEVEVIDSVATRQDRAEAADTEKDEG